MSLHVVAIFFCSTDNISSLTFKTKKLEEETIKKANVSFYSLVITSEHAHKN